MPKKRCATVTPPTPAARGPAWDFTAVRDGRPHQLVVFAPTWFEARALAAQQMGVDPAEMSHRRAVG